MKFWHTDLSKDNGFKGSRGSKMIRSELPQEKTNIQQGMKKHRYSPKEQQLQGQFSVFGSWFEKGRTK